MEWIAAALIFIAVLYKFPKFTFSLIGLAIFLVICFISFSIINHYFVDLPARQEREDIEKSVSIAAIYDTQKCFKEFPIEVKITNNSKWDIKKINFRMELYNINYSESRATQYYSNDRVIRAGKSFNICYKMEIPKKDIFYLEQDKYAYRINIASQDIDFFSPDEQKPWQQKPWEKNWLSNYPIVEEQPKKTTNWWEEAPIVEEQDNGSKRN